MGYADLAAGDAWKAVLLFDFQLFAFRKQLIEIPNSEASKRLEVLIGQLRGAYQELITSTGMLEDYQNILKICAEGTKKYGKHLHDYFRKHSASAIAKIGGIVVRSKGGFELSPGQKFLYQQMHGMGENELRLQSGWTLFVPYPFTPAKYLTRQDDTVKEAQALFHSASSNCRLS